MQRIINFLRKFQSNRFTSNNIVRITYYSINETIYATENGKVYYHNYKSNTSQLITNISSETQEQITAIDAYQGKCVIGTQSGKVFYIQHINIFQCPQKAKVILQLPSPISNLDIFKSGGYRVLYVAGQDGSILALIREQKQLCPDSPEMENNTFDVSTSQSSHSISVIQSLQNSYEIDNTINQDEQQVVETQSQNGNSNSLIDEQQNIARPIIFDADNFIIKRNIRFVGEHGSYMHAKSQILCYCSERDDNTGIVRFFNQMNGCMIWKQEVKSSPLCCQMQYMKYKGNHTLICHVGLTDSSVVRFNIHNKTSNILNFYEQKSGTFVPCIEQKIQDTKPRQSMQESMNSSEIILQKNENVNVMMQNIDFCDIVVTQENESEFMAEISYKQSFDVDKFTFQGGIHALWYLDNKIFASDLKNIYIFNKIILTDTNQRGYQLISSLSVPKNPIRAEFVEVHGRLQFHASYPKGACMRADYLQNQTSWDVKRIGI